MHFLKYLEFLLALIYSLYFHIKRVSHKPLDKNYFKSKIFNNYLKKNEEVWNDKEIEHNNGEILVTNFVHHVGYTLTECIIGKNIQSFSKLKIVGLIDHEDGMGKKILESFNIKDVIEFQKISFFSRLFYLVKSFQILKKIATVDDLINFSIDEINFGRVVYDHILRFTGIGSTNYLNYKFYIVSYF